MKMLEALRILLISIFWIFNKYASGSSSTTEDTNPGSKGFSCAGKVIGGYYADVQEKCQMFHVCTIGENEEIRDIVFRCLNGTVFDQETRVCEREEEVNCAIAESFFHLNNDLYGPGIIPETANALKHALGQTHRQITVLKSDKETTNRDANSLCSGVTNAASLVVDVASGCRFLDLCLPQQSKGYAVQTFVCEDKNHVFDPITKLCTKKRSVHCNTVQTSSSFSSFREAQFFSTYLLNLCPLFPSGSLMIDSLSGCEQYFQCPLMQYSNEPIMMKRCPTGYLFSQVHQKCVPDNSIVCSRDLYSLLKLFELKSSGFLKDGNYKHIVMKSLGKVKTTRNNINNIPFVSRKKRAFTFEDRNLHRELASGSLTNAAGIFSDHVSVIEAQGPGNVLEGKINNPKFPLTEDQNGENSKQPSNVLDLRYKKEKSVAPETSLELNKTVLNGATIEVSKIASPDHKGEVTITSIVPKLVRHNGNGHKTERSDDEVSSPNPTIISNGKTKITLLGSSHSKSEENKDDETIIEQLDPTNSTLGSEVTDKSERDTSMQTENPESSKTESATHIITDAAPSETTVAVTTEKPQEQTTILTTSTTTTTTTTPPPTTTTTTTTTSTTTTSTTTTTLSTTSVQPESSTQEEKVETNFTCKDKELEQFYPDIEKDCKLFHYCSPGFSENEVLDLTFVCSNDTRFDIRTNKCQDMNTVICGEPVSSTTTSTTTPTTTSEAASSSAETSVSTRTTTITTSPSTSTLESTTTSPELLVSSSTNIQTVSEAVEDSTMTLTSGSEGSELTVISTVSEDPKSDSTESIIPDEEGSAISSDLKSEKVKESESKVTNSGAEKRSPTDSSIITEMVTEGSEKDQATDLLKDNIETTTADNLASIISSSDDSNNKNIEESSTVSTIEKVSPSDADTDSSLDSTTNITPKGTVVSSLDSGTSTK